MALDKPPIFRWYDFWTFGAMAIIATVLVAIVQFNGLNRDVAWWRWVGTWAVAVGFWAGYVRVLLWRKQLRDRIAYITKHGLMVLGDGGTVPLQNLVESETEMTIRAWDAAFDAWIDEGNERTGAAPRTVLAEGVMVFVKPLPFELHTRPGKLAGFAKPWARSIAIGIDRADRVSDSALAHELGHVILAGAGLNPSKTTLQQWSSQYGVPA